MSVWDAVTPSTGGSDTSCYRPFLWTKQIMQHYPTKFVIQTRSVTRSTPLFMNQNRNMNLWSEKLLDGHRVLVDSVEEGEAYIKEVEKTGSTVRDDIGVYIIPWHEALVVFYEDIISRNRQHTLEQVQEVQKQLNKVATFYGERE